MVDDPANETGNLPVLPDDPGQFILYQTQDGRTRVECRFQNETIWLSQALMAELYQTSKQNISLHLQNLYREGELDPDRVVKEYLTTGPDGKTYGILHYNLDAILTVGYRVKSHRGTQSRMMMPWPRPSLVRKVARRAGGVAQSGRRAVRQSSRADQAVGTVAAARPAQTETEESRKEWRLAIVSHPWAGGGRPQGNASTLLRLHASTWRPAAAFPLFPALAPAMILPGRQCRRSCDE